MYGIENVIFKSSAMACLQPKSSWHGDLAAVYPLGFQPVLTENCLLSWLKPDIQNEDKLTLIVYFNTLVIP